MKMKVFMTVLLAATMANIANAQDKSREIWSGKRAAKWYKQHEWQRGSNFIPSYAINQLEMWQPETFDTAAINRELEYAASIETNSMRVFLHHDIFRKDGTPYSAEEVTIIKSLTGEQ